jgi:hypothetical protein
VCGGRRFGAGVAGMNWIGVLAEAGP